MNFIPQKNLAKDILHIAGPAIAGLSSQMIVSIVNTAMVGRLENTQVELAAMGLGFLGTWAITSLFSSLSTGTHVLAARRHGEGNHVAAGGGLKNSPPICAIPGVVFGGAGSPFSPQHL